MPTARGSRSRWAGIAVSVLLVVAACGDDAGSDDSITETSAAPATTTTVAPANEPVTATPEVTDGAGSGESTGDSLCAIGIDSVGTMVAVTGVVGFLDVMPDGTLLGLEGQGCVSPVWIQQEALSAWSDQQRSMLTAGAALTLAGVVAERDGEAVVQVEQGPDVP